MGNVQQGLSLEQINQRDLRMRSQEIMDAVENGPSFLVTRDNRAIGDLTPIKRHRTFVSHEDFTAVSLGLPTIDVDQFRGDLQAISDQFLADPYAR